MSIAMLESRKYRCFDDADADADFVNPHLGRFVLDISSLATKIWQLLCEQEADGGPLGSVTFFSAGRFRVNSHVWKK